MKTRRKVCLFFAIGLLVISVLAFAAVALGDAQCICVISMSIILTMLVYTYYLDDRDELLSKQKEGEKQ